MSKKILIICAVPKTRGWLEDLLSKTYQTGGADKLMWAMRELKSSRYDMAIIDRNVTDDGLTALELIREVKEANPNAKIILFGDEQVNSKADFFIKSKKGSLSRSSEGLLKAIRYLFER